MSSRNLPLRPLARALIPAAAVAAAAGLFWVSVRARPAACLPTVPEPPAGLPPGRLVHVPGRGEFFVREAGPDDPDAPTIVLLHGWMFSADLTWFACYEELARSARVIAADHRGHGRGPRPTEPFRLTDVADDVAALLRHLDATPAVAVGYSMGGTIAQLLWQRHPDVVSGLVLAATSATFTENARDRWTWRAMGVLQLILRVVPRDVLERAACWQAKNRSSMRISRLIHPETPAQVIDLLPWITGELCRNSAEDVAEAGREMGRFDTRGWLGGIDVPTAVLVLLEDGLVPLDRQLDLAARIPGCHVQELPLDHDAVVSQPGIFLPALLKAVQEVLER